MMALCFWYLLKNEGNTNNETNSAVNYTAQLFAKMGVLHKEPGQLRCKFTLLTAGTPNSKHMQVYQKYHQIRIHKNVYIN